MCVRRVCFFFVHFFSLLWLPLLRFWPTLHYVPVAFKPFSPSDRGALVEHNCDLFDTSPSPFSSSFISTVSPGCDGSQDKCQLCSPVGGYGRGSKNGFTCQHTPIRKPREGSKLMACKGLYLFHRPSLVGITLISCTDVTRELED